MFAWALSFVPAYGMRSAGDVKFAMTVSVCTMWLCRVVVTIFLVKVAKLGILSMWIGMFSDWTVRAIIFTLRFKRGKWAEKKVLRD